MPSSKPEIFEALFRQRVDVTTGKPLSGMDMVVRRRDITSAMAVSSSTLEDGNPANFLKDWLRSPERNTAWPAIMRSLKWSARQVYGSRGEGKVFEFIRYTAFQNAPFPDLFSMAPSSDVRDIESISLPSIARSLGRTDESWLIQTCVSQRLIETHFALTSGLQVVDIFHLQNSVKMTPEIDALFLITFTRRNLTRQALVTVEVKRDDFLLPHQIMAQVAKMGHECLSKPALSNIRYVIGLACGSLMRGGERVVDVFQLKPISVYRARHHHQCGTSYQIPVEIAATASYRFRPAISGI